MKLLGLVMILAGVVLAAYVGFWVCVVGGILQVAEGVQAGDAMDVAWGVIRFIAAWPAAYLGGLSLVLPGFFMATKA